MKVALLGAGHIGQTIARLLHASGDFQVTVFDKNASALAKLAAQGIATHRMESDSLEEIAPQLRGKQAVVNALPYHLAVQAARMASQAGCHYFDLTEDVAATKEIKKLAAGTNTAFMPQ